MKEECLQENFFQYAIMDSILNQIEKGKGEHVHSLDSEDKSHSVRSVFHGVTNDIINRCIRADPCLSQDFLNN